MEPSKNKEVILAIVSPHKDAASETFITAHKEFLKGKKFFYSGGFLPNYLDDYDKLLNKSFLDRLRSSSLRLKYKGFSKKEIFVLRSLLKNNINIVLAEYGPTGALLTPICKVLNIPLIVHFHGYDAHNHSMIEKFRSQYQDMFDYATAIISVSNTMTKCLVELGCQAKKIVYNPYGPRKEFFDIQADYEANQFLAIGRFVDKKAPYLTLMAFKDVLGTFPQARITMAGDGYLMNTCRNLAKAYGLSDFVNFPGVVSHEQVKKLMTESFCFVQHSVVAENGDSEGSPVGIIEAAAAGLPIVATTHAGIIETVLNGKTGFLVNELDKDEMSNKMIALFQDRQLARRMAIAGKNHVYDNFNIEKHIRTLDSLVSKALKLP